MSVFNMLITIGNRHIVLGLVLIASSVFVSSNANGQRLRIRDICRVKGQEVNNLHGMGLVVGLKGTGDGDAAPTNRALARMMQVLGAQISTDNQGRLNLSDVSDSKNVALVFVTAQVPATGAQQGDLLDVTVSAINAKSLEGGLLTQTGLYGPRTDDPTVYALAEGNIGVRDDGNSTRGMIMRGAKMETTVQVPYHINGKMTLIIDRDFANFDTAQRVEEAIRALPDFTISSSPGNISSESAVRAIDQIHVEVMIPEVYQGRELEFISQLMLAPITLESNSNRVVINEREGIVIIGEDVTFAPALVTHKNLRVEAAATPGIVSLSPGDRQNENPKLKALADALDALKVPTADLIAIIKELKRKGDLYGEVVLQ